MVCVRAVRVLYGVCVICCVCMCVCVYVYVCVCVCACVCGVLCVVPCCATRCTSVRLRVLGLPSYLTPAPTSHPPSGAPPTFDKTVDVRKLENKRFKKFVASAEQEDRCNGLNLQSLLIMPVQRMPRYKLMLDEIIKRTDASSCVQYEI